MPLIRWSDVVSRGGRGRELGVLSRFHFVGGTRAIRRRRGCARALILRPFGSISMRFGALPVTSMHVQPAAAMLPTSPRPTSFGRPWGASTTSTRLGTSLQRPAGVPTSERGQDARAVTSTRANSATNAAGGPRCV